MLGSFSIIIELSFEIISTFYSECEVIGGVTKLCDVKYVIGTTHEVFETRRIDCKRDIRRDASNYRIVRLKLQQSSQQTEAATRGLAISSDVHVLAYLSPVLYLFLHGTLSAPFVVPVFQSPIKYRDNV